MKFIVYNANSQKTNNKHGSKTWSKTLYQFGTILVQAYTGTIPVHIGWNQASNAREVASGRSSRQGVLL